MRCPRASYALSLSKPSTTSARLPAASGTSSRCTAAPVLSTCSSMPLPLRSTCASPSSSCALRRARLPCAPLACGQRLKRVKASCGREGCGGAQPRGLVGSALPSVRSPTLADNSTYAVPVQVLLST